MPPRSLYGALLCLALTTLPQPGCGGRDGGLDDTAGARDLPTDGASGACDALATADRVVTLDGLWDAEVRYRDPGGAWEAATALGPRHVPGWLFPFGKFPAQDREVELSYSTTLATPAGWTCAQGSDAYLVVVELDSADYFATVTLEDELVGQHEGYIGRFAAPLGVAVDGKKLRVSLLDGVRNVDAYGSMEAFPHVTLQGADTGGWGINPVGLPGSVRLRLIDGTYLRNLYAATVAQEPDSTRVRVGLAAETFGGPPPTRAHVRITDPGGAVLAEEEAPITLDAQGEAFLEVVVSPALPTVGLGAPVSAASVEVELVRDGVVTDARVAPLVNRLVQLGAGSLTVNGERHFARGAGVHHLYRALASNAEPQAGDTVALDDAVRRAYETRLTEAASVAQWLRPGHIVPDPVFSAVARSTGLMLYQDFPLHWNTDFATLKPDEIRRQFREFLWRVAAEPAVGIVALHNEAEIYDDAVADLQTTQGLIDDMLAMTAEVAPQLVAIGCSGCRGTAQFGGNAAYPVDDVIADVHAYFGSWWSPIDGFEDLPQKVAGLVQAPLPAFWSEMGNGWIRHFAYLAALTDQLEPDSPAELVALRRELEGWLRAPNGAALTLRQFYAGVFCYADLGVAAADLPACVQTQVATRTDAEFIAWAKRRYLAGWVSVEGNPSDPVTSGALVTAHWLAAQLFASRWLWANGQAMLGVASWERPENGYPWGMDGGLVSAEAIARSRAIVAAANAPMAVQLWPMDDGSVELRLINDGQEAALTCSLRDGTNALTSRQATVPTAGALAATIPQALLAGHENRTLRVECERGGSVVAEDAVFYAPGP